MNLPGIKYDKKSNTFKLYCGWCKSTDIRLESIGNSMYTIYCQKYCSPTKKKNVVCNVGDIKGIAMRCCNKDIDVYYRMVNDIYLYLELEKVKSCFSKEYLEKEKMIVSTFNIEMADEVTSCGMDKNGSAYCLYKFNDQKYMIKINTDMNIYYIKESEFKKLSPEDKIGKDKWEFKDNNLNK